MGLHHDDESALLLHPAIAAPGGPEHLDFEYFQNLPGRENLFDDPGVGRMKRLAEAARQVGVAVDGQALLRVVETDPESRLPERRVVMVPLVEIGS